MKETQRIEGEEPNKRVKKEGPGERRKDSTNKGGRKKK